MLLAMKLEVALDSINVGTLGMQTVEPDPDVITRRIKQSRLSGSGAFVGNFRGC
jgi:hypothetical protein